MKKLSTFIIAVALIFGMAQCKKQEIPATPDADGKWVHITLNMGDGGKHIVYPNTGAVVYTENDTIYVGNDGKFIGKLIYENGVFSGDILNPQTTDYLHFYFFGGLNPGKLTAGTAPSFNLSISDQTSNLRVLSYGKSKNFYTDGTAVYSCLLENKCGLVKFITPDIAGDITVKGMKNTVAVDFGANNAATSTEGDPYTGSIDGDGDIILHAVSSTERWAILLVQNQVDGATVTAPFHENGSCNVPAITNNGYYNGGVSISGLTPKVIDLATVTGHTTIQDGYRVIGTLGGNYKISIADGASVTLDEVNINNNTKSGKSDCAGITCLGNAVINLYGGSIINSSSNNYPGIQAGPSDKTLTIQGEGSLEVQGGSDAAGIGGGGGITCGNISLLGGAITACGGDWGAGIGSGSESSCGNIVIRECRVIARGGTGGAGIGSGWGGSCLNIEIDGGTITAEGGSLAAGIGSGQNGHCGNVEIEGGSINATGGEGASNIGAGYGGECGTVTLPPPEGALRGLFSVSSTKQVRFSQGNLLSDGTFAANQYTYGDHFAPNYIISGPTIDWYALSPDEWNYLYRHSTCGFATVNGIHGLIILPDNYTGSSIANPFRPNWIGTYETCPWDDNTYSGDDWTAMENNGVVFLPAAGYYYNGSLQYQGEKGYYYSSSEYLFGFYCNAGLSGSWTRYVSHDYSSGASSRYSIRLVRTEQTD